MKKIWILAMAILGTVSLTAQTTKPTAKPTQQPAAAVTNKYNDNVDDRMKGPNGEKVYIGTNGGRYYLSAAGKKVYIKRKKKA